MTLTIPAPPSDVHGQRGALRRPVFVAFLAIVVAGTAVPATTKVAPPAKVGQKTKTPRPSVGSRQPRPAVRPRAAAVKTTLPHPATAPPRQRAAAVKTTLPHPATAPPRPVSPTPRRTRALAVEPQRVAPASRLPPAAGAGEPVKAVGAIPNGGYVLPDGHFRVTGDARTILDFALRSRCAGSIALPPIGVDTTGAFDFAGHPSGAPAGTIVHVAGRFVSSREARGTTKISGGGCRGVTVSFVAHLS